MPVLFLYILKLSICLAIIYLFYQLVLRRLTFYNSNRWYLVGYTVLSFLIPLINITPVLEKNSFDQVGFVQMIPAVEKFANSSDQAPGGSIFNWVAAWGKWDWILFLMFAGATFFLLRLIVRCISFWSMRRNAECIPVEGMKLYQVNKNIIPFSFGNGVFINSDLHTGNELKEIIRHEFVHVKQRHTLDIIWSEWLCIINWYNPFAWMLKRSIRQNLEFIADDKVLQNGVDRREYQYLLLKVIGNNHFSIAPKFNFSSLKKRIIMMNRLQSARVHLVKFVFILPLLAVLLLAFRGRWSDRTHEIISDNKAVTTNLQEDRLNNSLPDTVPPVKQVNEKNYIIQVNEDNGDGIIVISDKNGKEVERLSLAKWNENKSYYEDKYGEIPPPPPPPLPPVPQITPVPPLPPVPPAKAAKLPSNVKDIHIVDDKATVNLKNGAKETYDLSNPKQKNAFEKKYGMPPVPPLPPSPPSAPLPPVAPVKTVGVQASNNSNLANVANDFEITEKRAVIHLKNGVTETYDLTNTASRTKFEKKYGRIINTNASVNVNTSNSVNITSTVNARNNIQAVTVVSPPSVATTALAGTQVNVASPVAVAAESVVAINAEGNIIGGEEEVLITITRKTTGDQLEGFKKEMKEKGIELKFDEIDFDNGKLVKISVTMKSKDGKSKSSFSVTDFYKVILTSVKSGDKTYFKVNILDNKTVI